ncbi:MAG: glycogen synthase GlgA [Candidatus Neomarinimicrobiota bacterium]
MPKQKTILIVTSESVPYAKSGGLADVTGALSKSLAERGHRVIVVMPYYASISKELTQSDQSPISMNVWMGDTEEWCLAYPKKINKNLEYYFIEFEKYFHRGGMYCNRAQQDYSDNHKRFAFLSQAAMYLCKSKQIKVDVVHAHDWQTAAALAYLKIHHWNDSCLGEAAGVLTIHNMGFQGKYPKTDYNYLGFREEDFNPDVFEDYGEVNLLKGGIHFADIVNTVSPTYALETLTDAHSFGLHNYLKAKGDNYLGILNGVDYEDWDPNNDSLIAQTYNSANMAGKKICKKDLRDHFSLDHNEAPIIGVVSRMAEQKGLNILANSIEAIINNMHVQFVILGSGDKYLEAYFTALAKKYPGKIGVQIGYNNILAHKIEAGADFFIMPSRYEPCGLNQIYSLRYGTLPIVRATGGLQDTVEQYNEKTGDGTGFKFFDLNERAIFDTVGWAVSTWFDRPDHYKAMQKRAMTRSFSWNDSAQKYEEVYDRAIASRKVYFKSK